jgi:hypothetical protein
MRSMVRLALVDGVNEPLGRVDLAAQILGDLGVTLGFAQQLAIDRRDAQLRETAALDAQLEAAVDLLDDDVRGDR